MPRYDVYGSECSYDDETDSATLTRHFLGTYEAEESGAAKHMAYTALTPDQRTAYKWGNMLFRGLVVEHGEKVQRSKKLTDKSLLRTVRDEYFDSMSEDEREAYFD